MKNKLINIKVDERLLPEISILKARLKIQDENAKLKLVTKEKPITVYEDIMEEAGFIKVQPKPNKYAPMNVHELMAMDFTQKQWGRWIFRDNLSVQLLNNEGNPLNYDVDLENLNSTFDVINMILHISVKKPHGFSYDIAGLTDALNEIYCINHVVKNEKFSGKVYALGHLKKIRNKFNKD